MSACLQSVGYCQTGSMGRTYVSVQCGFVLLLKHFYWVTGSSNCSTLTQSLTFRVYDHRVYMWWLRICSLFFLGRILVYVCKVLWLFVYFNMYVNSLQFSSNTVNIAQRTGNNLLLVHSHTVCGYTIIVFYGKNIRHKKLDLHSYRLVCSSVSEFWLFIMSDVIYSML